ncbi:DUF2513 domain-containing protein [Lysinibacillus mangiferihumi]|uniref:DUF2513 domain-containing protein n=1 Tax=Lysinibacillus mangiferihumi TaxID=1130819 RepID=A0A4U2YX12_9BACI|nr:DUF2513 domain-containing protein [Lysinibacillus mangiferihumi]TKI65605.1 DUF2513 domain-containing protein [Lysinibacillus mangiferihumi]
MKLNHDLIRDLLLAIEEISNGHANFYIETIAQEHLPQYDFEEVEYHNMQLAQAGLIKVANKNSHYVLDLTWDGHQYIASIREQSIWNKTKTVVQPFGVVTLDVIKDVATKFIAKSIGIE